MVNSGTSLVTINPDTKVIAYFDSFSSLQVNDLLYIDIFPHFLKRFYILYILLTFPTLYLDTEMQADTLQNNNMIKVETFFGFCEFLFLQLFKAICLNDFFDFNHS